MKRFVLIILGVLVFTEIIMSNNFYGKFCIKDNDAYIIDIKDNVFTISNVLPLNESDNILFTSECSVLKDTLFVHNGDKQYLFKIINNGVVVSLTDIFSFIKKGDKLEQIVYYCNKSPFLIGNERKNNLKNGKWKYIDESGKVSGVIFNEGKIVGTYDIKTSRESEE